MGTTASMTRPAGVAANSTPGRFGAYGGRYVPETLMAALLSWMRHTPKRRRMLRFMWSWMDC